MTMRVLKTVEWILGFIELKELYTTAKLPQRFCLLLFIVETMLLSSRP